MVKSVRLSCTSTPQVREAIDSLLWSGLWGRTRAEVVERLVCHALLEVTAPADLQAITNDAITKSEAAI